MSGVMYDLIKLANFNNKRSKKSNLSRNLLASAGLASTVIGGSYLFHNKLYKKWLRDKAEAELSPSKGLKLHYADAEGGHVMQYGDINPAAKYKKGFMSYYDKLIKKIKRSRNKNRDIVPY